MHAMQVLPLCIERNAIEIAPHLCREMMSIRPLVLNRAKTPFSVSPA